MQYSIVRAVQYSIVQYSTVRAAQYGSVRAVQYVQYTIVQYSIIHVYFSSFLQLHLYSLLFLWSISTINSKIDMRMYTNVKIIKKIMKTKNEMKYRKCNLLKFYRIIQLIIDIREYKPDQTGKRRRQSMQKMTKTRKTT